MKFREATQDEWRLAQNTEESAERIQLRAEYILDALAITFNGKAPGGVDDLTFTKQSGGIKGDVVSKFGVGRFRLQFSTKGNPVELFGELILERQTTDNHDRTAWQSCMLVQVPAHSKWTVGNSSKPSDIANFNDEDRYFALGVMAKFAIMTGPLWE